MRPLLNYWLFCLFFTAAFPGLARAGGGGGGGGHGGGGSHSSGGHSYHSYSSGGHGGSASDMLLLFPLAGIVLVVLVYAALQNAKFRVSQDAARLLIAQLGQQDALWNFQKMTTRVTEVFFRVQQAWTQNNQELARDCMSARLYQQHKAQTDAMLARGQRNVLQDIKLAEVAIYSVADYQDDTRDTFAAWLRGSVVDYTVNEPSPELPDGTLNPEHFTEVWTFVRVENSWVLDSIAPQASNYALGQAAAYSEQLGGAARAS